MNQMPDLEKLIKDSELLMKESQRIHNEMVQILGDFKDTELGYNPYHHSSIYQISSANSDMVYVGSTTKDLQERLKAHEHKYTNYKNNINKNIIKNRPVTSFKILKCGDYIIELLELVCVENEKELLEIEGKWQRKTLNKVNIRIEGRTNKQYNDDYKQKRKDYKENNKEKIKQQKKEYRDNNKEKVKQQKKEAYERNKLKIKEYNENNKSKIKLSKNKPILCECGMTHQNSNTSKHKKSQSHINYIKSLPIITNNYNQPSGYGKCGC